MGKCLSSSELHEPKLMFDKYFLCCDGGWDSVYN